MNFGEALAALKEGKKVSRSVWGGFWILARNVKIAYAKYGDTETQETPQLILAILKDGKGIAPATPYQEDLLAEDWSVID